MAHEDDAANAASGGGARAKTPAWKTAARVVFFVGGVALAVWAVGSAGLGRVMGIVGETWRWLPLVALLEVGFVSTDVLALRVLLGDAGREVTLAQWVRSTALAYASTILLPAGRAAGEATRATVLSPAIGLSRASKTCARLQACVLVGNATISMFCLAAVALGTDPAPALLAGLATNAVACAALATALVLVLGQGERAVKLRAFLRRFVARKEATEGPALPSPELARVSLFCVAGRLLQAAQYGVVLHAVGGVVTPLRAFATQGAHLVGAAAGDLVPGQLGANEGACRAFAGAFGLGSDPARAVAVALTARLAQMALTVVCLVVAFAVGAAQRETSARARS